jgi:hypothetical protein
MPSYALDGIGRYLERVPQTVYKKKRKRKR